MDERQQTIIKNIDNYQDFLLFINEKKNTKSKILVHACCAPCSTEVLEVLKNTLEIVVYYYNPNVYPEEEYYKRLNEFKKLPNDYHVLENGYVPKMFEEAIAGLEQLGEKSLRCYKCYEMRLEETARMASSMDFDYFTTTLSISPHKDSRWINEIGLKLSEKYNINYLYSDFKKNDGYKKSILLSRQFDLYRQEYCGCKYSKNEKNK